MTWEQAYIRVLDALGFVVNGSPYIHPSAYLRRRYTARRHAGMAPKVALGYAMGDCERAGR